MKKTIEKKKQIENPDLKISVEEALFLEAETKIIQRKNTKSKKKKNSLKNKKTKSQKDPFIEFEQNAAITGLEDVLISHNVGIPSQELIEQAKNEAIEIKESAYNTSDDIIEKAKLEAISIKEAALLDANRILEDAKTQQEVLEKKSQKLNQTVSSQLDQVNELSTQTTKKVALVLSDARAEASIVIKNAKEEARINDENTEYITENRVKLLMRKAVIGADIILEKSHYEGLKKSQEREAEAKNIIKQANLEATHVRVEADKESKLFLDKAKFIKQEADYHRSLLMRKIENEANKKREELNNKLNIEKKIMIQKLKKELEETKESYQSTLVRKKSEITCILERNINQAKQEIVAVKTQKKSIEKEYTNMEMHLVSNYQLKERQVHDTHKKLEQKYEQKYLKLKATYINKIAMLEKEQENIKNQIQSEIQLALNDQALQQEELSKQLGEMKRIKAERIFQFKAEKRTEFNQEKRGIDQQHQLTLQCITNEHNARVKAKEEEYNHLLKQKMQLIHYEHKVIPQIKKNISQHYQKIKEVLEA